jgi:hypothetical protein
MAWNAGSAPGDYSTAFGEGPFASGTGSTASGWFSGASGNYSTAAGQWARAYALDAFVVGSYNVGGGNPTAWVGTDPLFEIGNGVYPVFSDALVVYKNGNTTITGTDNELPNQVFVGSHSILTPALADNRYVLNMGTASGPDSFASGYDTTASGTDSMASGYGTTASGVDSTASGSDTTAAAQDSFVIGAYNGGLGITESGTTWVATDPLFEIGNGASGAPSDALVVYKNGNTVVSGALVVSGTTGSPNQINGTTRMSGTVIVTGTMVGGTVVASGTNLVLIPQQGDLSMGAFTAGATPQ